MSDLTRYRIDIPDGEFVETWVNRTNVSPYADGSGANVIWNDVMEQARQERMLVRDDTLQQIADAYITLHNNSLPTRQRLEAEAELSVLLGGLVNDE